MKRYPVPAQAIRREITVLNSRFISSLSPAFSVDEARQFINQVKAEFPDASHHVPAFLIGYGESVTAHCSDAGEPSGTAGRPILAVLQGSGLGDAVLVVTRYFGGTKLGTGGLVRAYSEAARTVLGAVPRAERVAVHIVMVEIPYSLLERTRRLVAAQQGTILDEDFGASIILTARFAVEQLEDFQTNLGELSNGAIQAQIIETGEALLPKPP